MAAHDDHEPRKGAAGKRAHGASPAVGKKRKKQADEDDGSPAHRRARPTIDCDWTTAAASPLDLPRGRLTWLEVAGLSGDVALEHLVPQPYGFGWSNYQVTDSPARWAFVLGTFRAAMTDDMGRLLPDVGLWMTHLSESELMTRGAGDTAEEEPPAVMGSRMPPTPSIADTNYRTLWHLLVARAAKVEWEGPICIDTAHFGPVKPGDAPSQNRFPLTRGQTTYYFYFFTRVVEGITTISFPVHLSSSRNPVPRRREGFCSDMRQWFTPHTVTSSRPCVISIVGETHSRGLTVDRVVEEPYSFLCEQQLAGIDFPYERREFHADDGSAPLNAKTPGKMVSRARQVSVSALTLTQAVPCVVRDGLVALGTVHVLDDVSMDARRVLRDMMGRMLGLPLTDDVEQALRLVHIFHEEDFVSHCPRRPVNEGLVAETYPFTFHERKLLWKRYKLNTAEDCDPEKERERLALSKSLLWEICYLLRVKNSHTVAMEGISIANEPDALNQLPFKFTGIIKEQLVDLKLHKLQPRLAPLQIATVGLHISLAIRSVHDAGFVFQNTQAAHYCYDSHLQTYKLVGGSKVQLARRPYDPRAVNDVQQLISQLQLLLGTGPWPGPYGPQVASELPRIKQLLMECDERMRGGNYMNGYYEAPAQVAIDGFSSFLNRVSLHQV